MTRPRFVCTRLSCLIAFVLGTTPLATAWADVVIDGSTVTHDIHGNGTGPDGSAPLSPDAVVDGFSVEVKSSTVPYNSIYGGKASVTGASARATHNVVSISHSTTRDVFGGFSQSNTYAEAQSNSVTIQYDSEVNSVFGGRSLNFTSYATAADNTVKIENGSKVGGDIYGGSVFSITTATASGNRILVEDGAEHNINGEIVGGFAYSTTGGVNANDNHVTVNGAEARRIIGGNADGSESSLAKNNTVNIGGSAYIRDNVIGGNAYVYAGGWIATSTGNHVNITGGEIHGDIYGGLANAGLSSSEAHASGNFIDISGGTINSGKKIYGGYSVLSTGGTGTAINNIITVSGSPALNSPLYGGFISDVFDVPLPGDAFTGNTLDIKTVGLTVTGIYNFQHLNFYVPSTGTTLLTVTGKAQLTEFGDGTGRSSIINVGINGAASPLSVGDRIVLINAGQVITNTGLNNTANGNGMQGLILNYRFDITQEGNQIIATVSNTGTANPLSKAFPQTFLGGIALLNRSLDAVTDLTHQHAHGIFATVQSSNTHYNAKIDLYGATLLTGFTGNANLGNHRLGLTGFLNHSWGDTDIRTDTPQGKVKGSGNLQQTGLGLLARLDINDTDASHPYTEASLQTGRGKSDAQHKLWDDQGQFYRVKHDTRSSYLATHLGAGYLWKTGQGQFDIYGKYLYARRGSDNVRLKYEGGNREEIHFDSLTSQRLKIGGRYAWTLGKVQPYVGLAWEREFDAKATSSVYHLFNIAPPNLKGNTSSAEIGLNIAQPLSISLNLQGRIGKQRGILGGVKLAYQF